MKKLLSLCISLCLIPLLSLTGYASEIITAASSPDEIRTALFGLFGIGILMVAICIFISLQKPFSTSGRVHAATAVLTYLATIAVLAVCVVSLQLYRNPTDSDHPNPLPEASSTSTPTATPLPTDTETIPETTVAPTEPERILEPYKTSSSDPANWNVTWEIIENNAIVESYSRAEPISFGDPDEYFALPGIATFRGNNYRNSATYGTAEISEGKLTTLWSHRIGMFNGWGGCAWTGQPLVVQWDEETKQIMNLYSSKKEKEGLVEVIYATLDGYIHFYDLEDGSKTRDPILMSMNFKGAGALDPRGYPLLYVGSGVNANGKGARMFIVSLIDGSILWEYGNKDSFANRNWTAFDSSPLVDAETDTLIWPGESGILYTLKLNTEYDKQNGTISINPDQMVNNRYSSSYSQSGRYLGIETSASIVDHYLYASENGGLFFCVDLNTMDLVWTQDTKDDSNSSPVFEWGDDGNGYLYTAPSLHWTATKSAGTVSIYKLNAQNGEILWEYPIDCVTVKDVSGGVQATGLLGKAGSNIEDLIIYAVARTPSTYAGLLIAFDKDTGEVVWQVDTKNYSWSSPVAIYSDDGKAYIMTCNASGKVRLVDGATGEVLYSLGLDETTEASPVVYNDKIVLGTREGVYCFQIS